MVSELRTAIGRETLLKRLPTQRELADHFGAPLREVRAALEQLESEGLVAASRGGYQVARRPHAGEVELHTVIQVQEEQFSASIFQQHITLGVDRECRRRLLGIQSRWVSRNRVDDQMEELAALESGPQVGWLLTDVYPSADLITRWQKIGRRIVMVDRRHPDVPLPTVTLDHIGATRLAADHLQKLGHRRIAVVGGSDVSSREYIDTIAQTVKAASGQSDVRGPAGHPANVRLTVETTFGLPFVRMIGYSEGLERLLKIVNDPDRTFTAIVVHNHWRAITLIGALEAEGFNIPDDLSVMGVGSEVSGRPGLTQVTLANAGTATDLGRLGVEMLASLSPSASPKVVRLEPGILRPGVTTRAIQAE